VGVGALDLERLDFFAYFFVKKKVRPARPGQAMKQRQVEVARTAATKQVKHKAYFMQFLL
jgi:hypothetical protein